jgi:hypothetical protein
MAKKPKDDRKFLTTATSGHPDLYPDVKIAEASYLHALEGHGTGYSMLDGVVAAIQNPEAIFETTAHSGVILTDSGTTDHNGHPIQVRIKVIPEEETGYLATFVFTSKPPKKAILLRKRGDKK